MGHRTSKNHCLHSMLVQCPPDKFTFTPRSPIRVSSPRGKSSMSLTSSQARIALACQIRVKIQCSPSLIQQWSKWFRSLNSKPLIQVISAGKASRNEDLDEPVDPINHCQAMHRMQAIFSYWKADQLKIQFKFKYDIDSMANARDNEDRLRV
jgi:hypothetical protein